MKPVDIVKIEKLIPIFKNGEAANAIEVARVIDLEDNSCQFNIIVGKGLYNIGDKAIYIQPDYCIPERELFKEYFYPMGDPKKSKLGKKGRIRAVKFNFNFENEMDPIYSNGILMNFSMIPEFDETCDLQEYFGVIKYVADEQGDGGNSGLTKGSLPYFLYATDETRIEHLKGHVDRCFENKEVLSFSLKRDGCLDAETLIETEKDGTLTIKEICEKKFGGKVKSLNIENNKLEYRKVLNTWIKEKTDNWYEIILEDDTTIKITGNQMVWLPELMCYRRVDELDGTETFLFT